MNPNMLIFIEGLNYANDMSMIKDSPISLNVPNKLVYSFHIYSWQELAPLTDYQSFADGLNANIGYILQEDQTYTAPLWLGEFGQNTSDDWWKFLIQYLKENDTIGWAYWAFNGYQHTPADDESFGILLPDMQTVRHDWKLSDLQSIQAQTETKYLF